MDFESVIQVSNSDGYQSFRFFKGSRELLSFNNRGNRQVNYYHRNNSVKRKIYYGQQKEILFEEYDRSGRIVYRRDFNGIYEKWKYGASGNLVFHEDSSYDYEDRWKFDSRGREVLYSRNKNVLRKTTYNDRVGTAVRQVFDRYGSYTEYLIYFDEKDNITYLRDFNGYEKRTIFDDLGQEILYKESNGFTRWSEYKEDKLLHRKDSEGYEEWNRYDEDGKLIFSCNTKGFRFTVENCGSYIVHTITKPEVNIYTCLEHYCRTRTTDCIDIIIEKYDENASLLSRSIGTDYEESFTHMSAEQWLSNQKGSFEDLVKNELLYC